MICPRCIAIVLIGVSAVSAQQMTFPNGGFDVAIPATGMPAAWTVAGEPSGKHGNLEIGIDTDEYQTGPGSLHMTALSPSKFDVMVYQDLPSSALDGSEITVSLDVKCPDHGLIVALHYRKDGQRAPFYNGIEAWVHLAFAGKETTDFTPFSKTVSLWPTSAFTSCWILLRFVKEKDFDPSKTYEVWVDNVQVMVDGIDINAGGSSGIGNTTRAAVRPLTTRNPVRNHFSLAGRCVNQRAATGIFVGNAVFGPALRMCPQTEKSSAWFND